MTDAARRAAFSAAAAALGVRVAADEPLARHTTFRIGGPADLFAVATTPSQLAGLADLATAHELPFTVLGGGSNVLVSDAGIRGVVIANQARSFGPDLAEGNVGSAGALTLPEIAGAAPPPADLISCSGAALAGLARWALRNGWAGLTWAVSVPGTVGGAVIGNAGAHGGDMAGTVAWTLVAYPGRGQRWLSQADLEFAYRSSLLKRQLATGTEQPVVLAVGFRLARGDVAEMAAQAEVYLARRRASQPVEPSAGSIFRNPAGDHAGRLVEAAGLKGYRIGGAQVSPLHANFIINTGGARAADVVALLNLMRQRVHALGGPVLVPEILFLGEWSEPPLWTL